MADETKNLNVSENDDNENCYRNDNDDNNNDNLNDIHPCGNLDWANLIIQRSIDSDGIQHSDDPSTIDTDDDECIDIEESLHQINDIWERGDHHEALARLLLLYPTADTLREFAPIWCSRIQRVLNTHRQSHNPHSNESKEKEKQETCDSDSTASQKYKIAQLRRSIVGWAENNFFPQKHKSTRCHTQNTPSIDSLTNENGQTNYRKEDEEESNIASRFMFTEKTKEEGLKDSLPTKLRNDCCSVASSSSSSSSLLLLSLFEGDDYEQFVNYNNNNNGNIIYMDEYMIDSVAEGFLARLLHRSSTGDSGYAGTGAKKTLINTFVSGFQQVIHSLFVTINNINVPSHGKNSTWTSTSTETVDNTQRTQSSNLRAPDKYSVTQHVIVNLIQKSMPCAYDFCWMECDMDHGLIHFFIIALICEKGLRRHSAYIAYCLEHVLMHVSRIWLEELRTSNNESAGLNSKKNKNNKSSGNSDTSDSNVVQEDAVKDRTDDKDHIISTGNIIEFLSRYHQLKSKNDCPEPYACTTTTSSSSVENETKETNDDFVKNNLSYLCEDVRHKLTAFIRDVERDGDNKQ